MSAKADQTASKLDEDDQIDRRVHLEVRATFEQAWVFIKPYLDRAEGQDEVSGFTLAIELRSEFPSLSQADVHLLVSAAKRMHRERRRPVPG